jgi:predicted RNase H-like HicB family nuclease
MPKVETQYLHYSVLTRKEGNQYASWCPELDVSSCGANVEEACHNLEEAVSLFLKTYSELGELKAKLDERGIVLNYEEDCPRVYLSEAHVGVPAFD